MLSFRSLLIRGVCMLALLAGLTVLPAFAHAATPSLKVSQLRLSTHRLALCSAGRPACGAAALTLRFTANHAGRVRLVLLILAPNGPWREDNTLFFHAHPGVNAISLRAGLFVPGRFQLVLQRADGNNFTPELTQNVRAVTSSPSTP